MRGRLCVDVYPDASPLEAARVALAQAAENASRLIKGTPLGNTRREERLAAAILTGKKWQTGRTITVRFLNGGPLVDRVKPHFLEWTKYANLDFRFVTSGAAEIRVNFDASGGSWSYLGTDNLLVRDPSPTLNFGWLTGSTPEAEVARVALHEVGHAIGLIHEHQHPERGFAWDEEAVYRRYSGPPNNWDRQTIYDNVISKYSETQTNFTEFDRASIMLYPIPEELTAGDYSVGWSSGLSPTDKALIAQQYPGREAPQPPTPPRAETVSYTALGRKPAPVDKPYRVTQGGVYKGTIRNEGG